MRQAFFALFERQAHEMINDGATVDQLAEAYLENLKTQFGDAVEVADEFKWEWVSIPHIYHTPFYVYAYAFGQLLVLSLYQQYKAEGDSFKPRYLDVLAAGGSDFFISKGKRPPEGKGRFPLRYIFKGKFLLRIQTVTGHFYKRSQT